LPALCAGAGHVAVAGLHVAVARALCAVRWGLCRAGLPVLCAGAGGGYAPLPG